MADGDSVSPVNKCSPALVRCELLCFLQEKCNCMTADHIVKICADFYHKDELFAARDTLDSYLSQRLPRRKGPDFARSTVEDMLKMCLDPSVTLPDFSAKDLARIPPVDVTHCDVSAILRELQSLRGEVRQMTELRTEVSTLKQQIAAQDAVLDSLHVLRKEVQDLRTELSDLRTKSSTSDVVDFPPLANYSGTGDNVPAASSHAGQSDQPSAARRLKAAVESGDMSRAVQKSRAKVVVGNSSNPKLKVIKSVMTTRKVDIFVSRLHPLTTCSELNDCVNSANSDITIHGIACNKLRSKFEDLYSSFHVEITVDSADLSRAVDLYMSADSWPVGIFIKRYFKRKDGHVQ